MDDLFTRIVMGSMTQTDLIHRFDGPAYQPELDFERLNNQHERIKTLMLDGAERTFTRRRSWTIRQ